MEDACLQFKSVPRLDDEALDALIVPVYKDGTAPAQLDPETRQLAEWVARESGPQKMFTATTHIRPAEDGVASRLVVVAAGQRDEFDVERARNVDRLVVGDAFVPHRGGQG